MIPPIRKECHQETTCPRETPMGKKEKRMTSSKSLKTAGSGAKI